MKNLIEKHAETIKHLLYAQEQITFCLKDLTIVQSNQYLEQRVQNIFDHINQATASISNEMEEEQQ